MPDNKGRKGAREVDEKLWLEARASAIKQGKTISQWLNEAIAEKLEKEKNS